MGQTPWSRAVSGREACGKGRKDVQGTSRWGWFDNRSRSNEEIS